MAIISTLEDIVGSENVTDKNLDLIGYSRTMSSYPSRSPDIVVLPETAEQVSEIMRLANRTRTPVTVRAGGTSGANAIAREGGIIIDLSKMNKILEINEEMMTITVQGGCSVYKAFKQLAKAGLELTLRPEFGPGVTMGAWINTLGSGEGMGFYGRLPQNITGIKVVLPSGEIVQTGAGSFTNCGPYTRYATMGADLMGLFMGSFGSLGVVVEITHRIVPQFESMDFVTFGFEDLELLVKTSRRILKTQTAWDIMFMDTELSRLTGLEVAFPLLLTISTGGSKEETEYRINTAKRIGMEEGGVDLGADMGRFGFDNAANIGFSVRALGRYSDVSNYWHSVSVLPELYKIAKEGFERYKLPSGWISWIDREGACSWIGVRYKEPEQWEDAIKSQREICLRWMELENVTPGTADRDKMPWAAYLQPTYRELLKTIKHTLDPNNILNPGLLPY